MNWNTSQNYSNSQEEHSTMLWRLVRCHKHHLLFKKLASRTSAMQRATGNRITMLSMTTNSVNTAPSQRDQNGASIARPTAQREAISTLNTQSPWEHMVITQETNWIKKLTEQTMSTMNWQWEQRRQQLISQATMDSFQRLISTKVQCNNHNSLEIERPLSSRTWLRTIVSNCLATQAINQWTQQMIRVLLGHHASVLLEKNSENWAIINHIYLAHVWLWLCAPITSISLRFISL